jgi:hypothetical protein
VDRGWAWNAAGEALVNSKLRIEIKLTGEAAIDLALQITPKKLSHFERVALTERPKQIRQEVLL